MHGELKEDGRHENGTLPFEYNTRTILPAPVPHTLNEGPQNQQHETGDDMQNSFTRNGNVLML